MSFRVGDAGTRDTPTVPSEWQRTRDHRLVRDRAWAQWAVHRWAAFPVDDSPRPLVLAGPAAWPEAGFRSGAAKIAFSRGALISDQPLPERLVEVVRTRMTDAPPTTEPLVISGVEHASTQFLTDRGRQKLPAYRLTGPDVDGALWVLDPAVVPPAWAPTGEPEPAPSEGSDALSVTAEKSR